MPQYYPEETKLQCAKDAMSGRYTLKQLSQTYNVTVLTVAAWRDKYGKSATGKAQSQPIIKTEDRPKAKSIMDEALNQPKAEPMAGMKALEEWGGPPRSTKDSDPGDETALRKDDEVQCLTEAASGIFMGQDAATEKLANIQYKNDTSAEPTSITAPGSTISASGDPAPEAATFARPCSYYHCEAWSVFTCSACKMDWCAVHAGHNSPDACLVCSQHFRAWPALLYQVLLGIEKKLASLQPPKD